MATLQTQNHPGQKPLQSFALSLGHAVGALVGTRQLLDEFTATAAHYDGLIDAIERAGWDLSRLEQIKHAFDETAQQLLSELVESSPEMSNHEEKSFLEPFRGAIHQFTRMSSKEKSAFRHEYNRFAELHAVKLRELATSEA